MERYRYCKVCGCELPEDSKGFFAKECNHCGYAVFKDGLKQEPTLKDKRDWEFKLQMGKMVRKLRER